MLCIHGGAAHAHWFDFVAPGLTPDHHVFSMDLRGHGDSAWADPHTYAWQNFAKDVNALAEKLDLRDYVLIGHSMGGMVSLVHAAMHPGRIGALVIVDSVMLMPTERVERMRAFGEKPVKPYAKQEELIARYRPDGGTRGASAHGAVQRQAERRRHVAAQGRPWRICEFHADRWRAAMGKDQGTRAGDPWRRAQPAIHARGDGRYPRQSATSAGRRSDGVRSSCHTG